MDKGALWSYIQNQKRLNMLIFKFYVPFFIKNFFKANKRS